MLLPPLVNTPGRPSPLYRPSSYLKDQNGTGGSKAVGRAASGWRTAVVVHGIERFPIGAHHEVVAVFDGLFPSGVRTAWGLMRLFA